MIKSHNNRGIQEKCSTLDISTSKDPNLDGDRLNFILLTLLYIIQTIPIGLFISVSMLLQSNKMVTYEDQTMFSISLWPNSMKLFWAPIVDALHLPLIGRRKSWLLPLQLLLGWLLLYFANNVDRWLPESEKPNIFMIMLVMFVINFLSGTLDIVVDGWALTMLKKENLGYASISNSIGILFGIFLGSVCFTLLTSEQFSSKYFGTTFNTGGLITIKNFLRVYGILVLLITILIGILKKEKYLNTEDDVRIDISDSYKILWGILKLPRIRVLAFVLFTAKIGFSAMDSVSNFKLIDVGVSKDDIMIITAIMCIIKLIMPIYVSKYITNCKPMSYYLNVMPIRLFWAFTHVVLVYFTPNMINTTGVHNLRIYYYLTLGTALLINEMLSFFMLLTLYAFFCRLSDPRFGGIYMTMFNTFYYLGFILSNTLVLKLVAILTFSKCTNDSQNSCSTTVLKNSCKTNGGVCEVYVDGYYIAIAICMTLGFIWYGIFRNIIRTYQSLSLSHWLVNIKHPKEEDESYSMISM